MEDNKLLNELRAQRELIQKHLEWMDQKIAALDQHEEQSTEAADEASNKTLDGAPEKVAETDKVSEAPPPEQEDVEDDQPFGRYKAPTANEIHRAKIGCLVLFVLSTLLFLFLLFGLPYLL